MGTIDLQISAYKETGTSVLKGIDDLNLVLMNKSLWHKQLRFQLGRAI